MEGTTDFYNAGRTLFYNEQKNNPAIKEAIIALKKIENQEYLDQVSSFCQFQNNALACFKKEDKQKVTYFLNNKAFSYNRLTKDKLIKFFNKIVNGQMLSLEEKYRKKVKVLEDKITAIKEKKWPSLHELILKDVNREALSKELEQMPSHSPNLRQWNQEIKTLVNNILLGLPINFITSFKFLDTPYYDSRYDSDSQFYNLNKILTAIDERIDQRQDAEKKIEDTNIERLEKQILRIKAEHPKAFIQVTMKTSRQIQPIQEASKEKIKPSLISRIKAIGNSFFGFFRNITFRISNFFINLFSQKNRLI